MKSGIDPDILRRVVGNDPEFLREVLEDFVCHAQSEITAIRAAFVSQDAEQMKIPTHRFKGSASLMGARQVVEACTRLEAAAGANDWPMIQSLMPSLDGLMHALRPDLDGGWTILEFRAWAQSCKYHRPAAILGQNTSHPVDVGLGEERPSISC